jgi:hypothetical protein
MRPEQCMQSRIKSASKVSFAPNIGVTLKTRQSY